MSNVYNPEGRAKAAEEWDLKGAQSAHDLLNQHYAGNAAAQAVLKRHKPTMQHGFVVCDQCYTGVGTGDREGWSCLTYDDLHEVAGMPMSELR